MKSFALIVAIGLGLTGFAGFGLTVLLNLDAVLLIPFAAIIVAAFYTLMDLETRP